MTKLVVYILTLRVHFWKFMLDNILMTLFTKHHVIKAERAETVQSDIVGYYPRSKLPFRGILVLQRKPFAFELFFCWASAGFFTFSSQTRSIVPTSNLCRNIQRPKNQLNKYFSETCISYLERTDKNTSTCTRKQHWHTLKHL